MWDWVYCISLFLRLCYNCYNILQLVWAVQRVMVARALVLQLVLMVLSRTPRLVLANVRTIWKCHRMLKHNVKNRLRVALILEIQIYFSSIKKSFDFFWLHWHNFSQFFAVPKTSDTYLKILGKHISTKQGRDFGSIDKSMDIFNYKQTKGLIIKWGNSAHRVLYTFQPANCQSMGTKNWAEVYSVSWFYWIVVVLYWNGAKKISNINRLDGKFHLISSDWFQLIIWSNCENCNL